MKRVVKPGLLAPLPPPGPPGADGWSVAVRLTELWLARSERVDTLLEGLAPGLAPQERARAQHLFYGVVRWASRLEEALAGLMAHPPRTKVRALLLVAGFEVLEGGAAAPVVHHAVERAKTVASPREAGLINAVARKLAARLEADEVAPSASEADPGTGGELARRWAHPPWLVARWQSQFGPEATARLLAWNQQAAPVYARWRTAGPVPEFLTATRWPGFYAVQAGHWEEIRRRAQEGELYLQDPSTRLSVELLAPRANETVLDACAAPGGKSLMLADAMQTGRLVALEAEGPRLARLRENLGRAPRTMEVALMPGDLRRAGPEDLAGHNLPGSYDAVLLDAPCSNTGVMRHRPDVKWRLQEGDLAQHAHQQQRLLRAAARLVRAGGRLVYSTCSLEPGENEDVVRQFLQETRGWRRERQVLAYPWVDGHDGAGAFLLRHD